MYGYGLSMLLICLLTLLQNFEDFDIANEDDHLEEFLGILRKDGGNPPPDATATAEDNSVKEKLE